MKWKIERSPKVGDQRYVKKFAWTPVFAYDEQGNSWTVWLENYCVHEKYEEGMCVLGGVLFRDNCWNFVNRLIVSPVREHL